MRNRLNLPHDHAANRFIPASRYYGDRYPRSMEQAFGPGARLDVDRRTPFAKAAPMLTLFLAVCVLFGLLLNAWANT